MSIQAGQRALSLIPADTSAAEATACAIPLVRDPIDASMAAEVAQGFKALADPVRLRLVSLTTAFDLTQPTISHHLKVLREAGIIGCERRGTWVYYWLVPAALARMSALLSPPAG